MRDKIKGHVRRSGANWVLRWGERDHEFPTWQKAINWALMWHSGQYLFDPPEPGPVATP